ncbi:hypothetical protein RHMOL_Rhmol03G0119300 [Rhododendron molle]|uniref:Uncharacterized protein n=1 Tax=Rhododendron molle TaxID=49168 RepID=A0ACC0PEH9_RHOML|nr:hypothetical protein RHMOL_Rhmol03G0119300 [Rhododendron molle]
MSCCWDFAAGIYFSWGNFQSGFTLLGLSGCWKMIISYDGLVLAEWRIAEVTHMRWLDCLIAEFGLAVDALKYSTLSCLGLAVE